MNITMGVLFLIFAVILSKLWSLCLFAVMSSAASYFWFVQVQYFHLFDFQVRLKLKTLTAYFGGIWHGWDMTYVSLSILLHYSISGRTKRGLTKVACHTWQNWSTQRSRQNLVYTVLNCNLWIMEVVSGRWFWFPV